MIALVVDGGYKEPGPLLQWVFKLFGYTPIQVTHKTVSQIHYYVMDESLGGFIEKDMKAVRRYDQIRLEQRDKNGYLHLTVTDPEEEEDPV